MRNPESSNSSSWVKKAMAVTAIAGTAAWLGAEPIANQIIGEQKDTAPTEPQKPEPKPAKRNPVDIAIGFDTTRSKIMDDLPSVTSATRDFLDNTKILKTDDKVTVCTFAEEAKCNSYVLPKGKEDLIANVGQIKPEARRNNMQTFVHHSITSIVKEVKGENGIVLTWTDGIEDQNGQKNTLPLKHAPVTIVVPQEGYLSSAGLVKKELGTQGVDVVLAKNSTDFGKLLEKFVGRLENEAQKTAEDEAKALYNKQLEDHATKMTSFENEKRAFAKKHAEAKEKIENVKSGIKMTAATLIVLAASALGTLLYMRNRPKLKGWIVDNRNEYPEIYRIPQEAKEISLTRVSRTLPGEIRIKPGTDGIYLNNQKIRNGTEIDENIFWFDKEPDEEAITKVTRKL
jgi:hypothetical protein